MKKLISFVLCTLMAVSFTACGSKAKDNSSSTGSADTNGGSLKLGMYVVTSQSGTDASADGNGNAQTDSTVAAVLVNEKGTIVDCIIDVAQTKLELSAAGEILNKEADLKSKLQLGDEYGMAARAKKGEWYKQAEGFCNYVIGKTADQVAGIALDESGVATDDAIKATTTIKIGSFVEAVKGAVNAAQDLGAKDGDKLGLSIVSSAADSTDASADGDGIAFVNSTYCAVATGSDGKITASVVDATQSKINISTEGAITTDFNSTEVLSKNVLKDKYGMNGRAEKGEWYKQAEGFCQYIAGKSADEVGGISIDESGKATDEALLATTTISIGDFVKAAKAAAANAK